MKKVTYAILIVGTTITTIASGYYWFIIMGQWPESLIRLATTIVFLKLDAELLQRSGFLGD